jgi:hypothetical protein
MNAPVLTSERQLYEFLREFISTNPHAVQLDGTSIKKGNRKAEAYLQFRGDDRRYVLAGDTTRAAIERFILEFERSEGKGGVLVPNPASRDPNHPSLIIAGTSAPAGWYCYEVISASSQSAA